MRSKLETQLRLEPIFWRSKLETPFRVGPIFWQLIGINDFVAIKILAYFRTFLVGFLLGLIFVVI